MFSFVMVWLFVEGASNYGNMAFIKSLYNKQKEGKMLYVSYTSFVLPGVLYWISIVSLCTVELIGVGHAPIRSLLYSLSASLSFSPFLFLIQLFPTFSHLVVMVDKMSWETLKFLTMISFVFITFTLFFFVLNVAPVKESVKEIASTSVTPGNRTHVLLLERFAITAYETFLIIFAARPPNDVFFTQSSFPPAAIFAYVACVVECAVLLLNLLIAVFSHQIGDVYRYEYESKTMIRLGMLLYLRNLDNSWRHVLQNLRRGVKIHENPVEMMVFTTVEKHDVELCIKPSHE